MSRFATTEFLVSRRTRSRRTRRRLIPRVLALEGRQLLSGAQDVPASEVTYQSQTMTFPATATDFKLAETIQGFNSSAGTLLSVAITEAVTVSSEFSAENLGASPTTITGTFGATVTANGPNANLAVAVPPVTQSFNAGPADGVNDDGGTSGKDFAPATTGGTQTTTLTAPGDITPYLGRWVTFTEKALATGTASSSSGGGISSAFKTQASETISVVYTYVPSSVQPPSNPAAPPTDLDPVVSPNPDVPTVLPLDPPSSNAHVVPDDFTGIGRSSPAVFRPSTAQWFIGGNALPFQFGGGGLMDIPVPGDYDGVGHTEFAVFRPATAQWFIGGHAQPISFGAGNLLDIPVPGDYDGIGRTELAVFRPATAQWFILNPITNTQEVYTFGATNLFDIPVPGDYDGTGHTELAVFRPSTAQWFIAGHAQPISFGAGNLFDIPVPGDYLGLGYTQEAVFRPSTAQWFIGGQAQPLSFGAGNLIDYPLEAPIASLVRLSQLATEAANAAGPTATSPTPQAEPATSVAAIAIPPTTTASPSTHTTPHRKGRRTQAGAPTPGDATTPHRKGRRPAHS